MARSSKCAPDFLLTKMHTGSRSIRIGEYAFWLDPNTNLLPLLNSDTDFAPFSITGWTKMLEGWIGSAIQVANLMRNFWVWFWWFIIVAFEFIHYFCSWIATFEFYDILEQPRDGYCPDIDTGYPVSWCSQWCGFIHYPCSGFIWYTSAAADWILTWQRCWI